MSSLVVNEIGPLPAPSVEPGAFAQLHNSPVLSDITIHYSGRSLLSHKVILTAKSKFFEKMFTGGFSEAEKNDIELHEDDPAALEGMFAFMYGVEIASALLGDTPLDAVMFYLKLCWVADKYNCKFLVAAIPSMVDTQLPQLLTDLTSASSERAAEILDEVVRAVYDTGEVCESIKETVLQLLFTHPDTSPLELAPKLSTALNEVAANFPEFGRDLFFFMMDLKGEKNSWGNWTKTPGWCKVAEVKCAQCERKWIRPAKRAPVPASTSTVRGVTVTAAGTVKRAERYIYCNSQSARVVISHELSMADHLR